MAVLSVIEVFLSLSDLWASKRSSVIVFIQSWIPEMAFFTRPQSANAAIKIVRPTTAADDDQLKGPSRKGPSSVPEVLSLAHLSQTLSNASAGIS